MLSKVIGDQYLLHDAPSYILHRLRKPELVRLWKVAGMWEDEAEDDSMAVEDEDDGGRSKKDLIDGLLLGVNWTPFWCDLLLMRESADLVVPRLIFQFSFASDLSQAQSCSRSRTRDQASEVIYRLDAESGARVHLLVRCPTTATAHRDSSDSKTRPQES